MAMKSLFLAGAAMSFLGLYFSISLIWVGLGLFLLSGLLLGIQRRTFSWAVRNPLFFPIALLTLAMTGSVLLAEPYPFKGAIGKIILPFYLFLFAWCFSLYPKAKDALLNISVFFSFLMPLISALQRYGLFETMFPGLNPYLYHPSYDSTHFLPVGFTRHHTTFAFTLIFLFHILLSQLLFSKDTRKKLILVSGCAFCLVGTLFTFSRGAWVALFISTSLVFLLVNWKQLLKVFMFFGILFSGLCVISPGFRFRIFSLNLTDNKERLELWQVCLKMFQESPWFGQGYDSFGFRFAKFSTLHLTSPETPLDPHNMYLEFLATSGLVGLFCFLVFLASTARVLAREVKTQWVLASIGVFSSFCIGGFFDRYFDMPHTLVPVLLILGLCTSEETKTPMAGRGEV